jgi:uncharacterized protein YecE (DUF72 family)
VVVVEAAANSGIAKTKRAPEPVLFLFACDSECLIAPKRVQGDGSKNGASDSMTKSGRIRIGIGGWDYEPWRESFYPSDLPKKRELEYASRQVSAIEINGTYYRTQKPESFAKWYEQTPDDFIFSVKASRYSTNRKKLAEAGESIERFLQSGLLELRHKLGPILWQFAPTKQFDPEDMKAFIKLLPSKLQGLRLHHVLDVRNESFMHPDFLALARRYQASVVFTDAEKYPSFSDVTSNIVYARLMRSDASVTTGYSKRALHEWAERVSLWAQGRVPPDLPLIENAAVEIVPREVFVFFINGAKEHAPAAARYLLSRLA